MTGFIGLLGLIGIAILIALLSLKNSKNIDQTARFYQAYSLTPISVIPAEIFNAFNNQTIYCREGKIKTPDGAEIPFYWCEWSIQSMIISGNSRQTTNDYYFAVAFSPGTVSEEFRQKAYEFADKSGRDFSQKAKDFFVLDTETPYLAKKLEGGSFLICWRAKKLAEDYQRAYMWLLNNLSSPQKEEVLPLESEISTVDDTTSKDVPDTTNEIPVIAEIPRLPITQFLEEMSATDQSKSSDIIRLLDSKIMDYHDTKGNSSLSTEDHAKFLEMSLEEGKAASVSITEIEFPVDSFLAKGFQIPELLKYEYQLAYTLDFPSRRLTYLDRVQLFLDDSEPLKIYYR